MFNSPGLRESDDAPASAQGLRRAALLAAAFVAVAGLALGAAVAGPADAASASVSAGKPGGGGGGGKPGGGGGTTELEYAAVGDSFAAGTGAGSYLDTTCYRSTKSYPRLLDADANLRLAVFLPCSGASTSVVNTSQVPAIPVTATRVSLTAGGNDVGFSDVMFNCFVFVTSSCESRIVNAETLVANGTVTANVAASVQAIKARAPLAKVVVTGYPLLFNEPSGYRWASRVNQDTLLLNAAIKGAAEANGAVFVDVVPAFTGHGYGSSSSWINGNRYTVESFHPNAAGQAAYATEIRKVIG